jgi:hypothetical protein
VSDLPASGQPAWAATLGRMRSGHRTLVTSLDPDAQFANSGNGGSSGSGNGGSGGGGDMLPLEGTDVTEQESAMKVVWQCVRSGQIARAQLAAKDQGMFWLAASLMGAADEFLEVNLLAAGEEGRQDRQRTIAVRHGNAKKSNWMNTCFDHSQRVNASYQKRSMVKNSSSQSYAGESRDDKGLNSAILEASVYGALSNNVNVLSSSPLLKNWPDMVWVAVKTRHDRQMHQILHGHRLRRARQSGLYPGCAPDELAAEEKYLERISGPQGAGAGQEAGRSAHSSRLVSAAFAPGLSDLLQQLYPRCAGPGELDGGGDGVALAESFPIVCMWRLQAAVMGGLGPLREHVLEMAEYFDRHGLDKQSIERGQSSSSSSKTGRFSGHTRLLRVYTHLCVWLKAAPASQPGVSDIVSGNGARCLHTITQRYIDVLIQRQRRGLVALYCVFLPREQRISTYVSLMQSLSASTRRIGAGGATVLSEAPNVEATEVMASAGVYFRADLPDITRAVVDSARLGTGAGAAVGATPGATPGGEYGASPAPAPGSRRRAAPELSPEEEGDQSLSVSLSRGPGLSLKRGRYESAGDRSLGMTSFNVTANSGIGSFSLLHSAGQAVSALGDGQGGLFGSGSSSFTTEQQSGQWRGQSQGQSQGQGQGEGQDVAVDDADVGRMDTLRWLCMDVRDRPEAVRQSNAFIRQFLLESGGGKTNQLRYVNRSILYYLLTL